MPQTPSGARMDNALILVAAIALAAVLGACQPAGAAPTPSPSGGIIRQDLGNVLPATAQGERLGLWHYTIPAGSQLVPHHHPGWQVARVAAGTLTYQIIKGEATVIRASGATEIHKPKAARAVGTALGANPVCVVLPCHRVIGATGALTGYAGGLEAKRFLLNLESKS